MKSTTPQRLALCHFFAHGPVEVDVGGLIGGPKMRRVFADPLGHAHAASAAAERAANAAWRAVQSPKTPMPDSPQIAQADIDAAWQLVMAVAPQLATDPCLLMRDGNLSAVAMQALQTRLTLRLRLDAEVVPVRRDWVQAVTALSRSAQQLADAQQAVQVVGALAPVAHTPAQTVRQVLDGSAPDAGAGAARPASGQQPAQPVQG